MTKDKALRMALEVLEDKYFDRPEGHVSKAIAAIKEALQINERIQPVQVSALEFVEMVYEKEHLVGEPIVWAQWPTKEKK